MIFIGMIFTTLATAALAKGTIKCNFSGAAGARWCSGAVGQLLIFHLTNTAKPNIRLEKDEKYVILRTAKNQIETHEEYVNHSEVFANGTITLGNAMKRHSGDYLLQEFESNGVLLKKVNMHLELQVPVSKPAVSQMCLSPELQRNISCSSEGDAVQFMLTLNGLLLVPTRCHSQTPRTRTESPSGYNTEPEQPRVSHVTVGLHSEQTGKLTCRVWNNFTKDETVIHLKSCRVSLFPVVTLVVTASVVSLLLLAALCLGLIKRNKRKPAAADEGNTGDEIVYADVRIKKTRKTGANSHQNAAEFLP
ncbi:uncharacterized protein LOC116398120 [Anarrhichthys ocellatus]|uniref:uncharacterized protein LOC116398120 n=1 Tax=Anarrhichthys ocellatus TaxID=433405 RepID=UPI0012EE71A7|nr:uncharacterized protein LOC116398120 [Anarrhichthys ocellatus]